MSRLLALAISNRNSLFLINTFHAQERTFLLATQLAQFIPEELNSSLVDTVATTTSIPSVPTSPLDVGLLHNPLSRQHDQTCVSKAFRSTFQTAAIPTAVLPSPCKLEMGRTSQPERASQ